MPWTTWTPRRRVHNKKQTGPRRKTTTTPVTTNNIIWKTYIDKQSCKAYYYNVETKEVTWDKPPEFNSDDKSTADTETTYNSVNTEDAPIKTVRFAVDEVDDKAAVKKKKRQYQQRDTTFVSDTVATVVDSSLQLFYSSTKDVAKNVRRSSMEIMTSFGPSISVCNGIDDTCTNIDDNNKKEDEMTTMDLLADSTSFESGIQEVPQKQNVASTISFDHKDNNGCNGMPSIFTCSEESMTDEMRNRFLLEVMNEDDGDNAISLDSTSMDDSEMSDMTSDDDEGLLNALIIFVRYTSNQLKMLRLATRVRE